MALMLSDNVTSDKAVQFIKAPSPSDVIVFSILNMFKLLQPEKAKFPIEVTDEGIKMEVREFKSLNAFSCIAGVLEGTVIVLRLLQLLKILYVERVVADVKPEQFLNASFPTDDTEK